MEKSRVELSKSEEDFFSPDDSKRDDDEEEEKGGMEPQKSQKPVKRRVKALYAKIKEQVEFYFGDSNLDKDRFFKKQIDKSEDGSISLSMLLSFNRIKALTEDPTVLGKALSTSTMLQLNEDKTTVRRITPYSKPKDVDKRTVYVELLPTNVDHDWIKRIFSRCGVVSYISIPRYKSTGDPKSFAFVEFETIEGAQKACKILNNPPTETGHKPGKFPKHNKSIVQLKKKINVALDVTDEKECDLSSSSEKSKPGRQKRKRKLSSCSADGKDTQSGKRPKNDLGGETSEEGQNSKILSEQQNDSVVESARSEDEEKTCSGSGKKKKKRKQRQQSESSGTKSQDEEVSDRSRTRSDSFSRLHESDTGSKTKYRRRAYSCSKLTDSELVGKVISAVPKTEPDLDIESESQTNQDLDLKVDPESKVEADESRQEPEERAKKQADKEVQKELVMTAEPSVDQKGGTDSAAKKVELPRTLFGKEGKPSLKRKREGAGSDVENRLKVPKHEFLEQEGKWKDFKKRRHQHRKPKKPYPHLRVISKEEWLQYKSDYLNTQRSNMAVLKKMLMEKAKEKEAPIEPEKQSRENYEFIPNVIINVKSDLLLNVKELKEKLKSIGNIAYIDLKEVDVQAHVRCKDEESARLICDSKLPQYKFSLLQGEEEKMYWEKLRSDRDAKINGKQRLKKRGTTKLMDKIEKLNTQNTKIYFED